VSGDLKIVCGVRNKAVLHVSRHIAQVSGFGPDGGALQFMINFVGVSKDTSPVDRDCSVSLGAFSKSSWCSRGSIRRD